VGNFTCSFWLPPCRIGPCMWCSWSGFSWRRGHFCTYLKFFIRPMDKESSFTAKHGLRNFSFLFGGGGDQRGSSISSSSSSVEGTECGFLRLMGVASLLLIRDSSIFRRKHRESIEFWDYYIFWKSMYSSQPFTTTKSIRWNASRCVHFLDRMKI